MREVKEPESVIKDLDYVLKTREILLRTMEDIVGSIPEIKTRLDRGESINNGKLSYLLSLNEARVSSIYGALFLMKYYCRECYFEEKTKLMLDGMLHIFRKIIRRSINDDYNADEDDVDEDDVEDKEEDCGSDSIFSYNGTSLLHFEDQVDWCFLGFLCAEEGNDEELGRWRNFLKRSGMINR